MVAQLDDLDDDMRKIVEALMNTAPYSTMTASEARELRRVERTAIERPIEPIARVEDHLLALDGRKIAIRIYRATAGSSDLPGLVWFHGGGYVFGGLDDADSTCRQLANRLGAVVVSVEYRLAPDYPFPAAVEDAFDSWRYVLTNASDFCVDHDRLAIGGDSAGGGLATIVCQRAATRNLRLPKAQLLIYPVTKFSSDPNYFDSSIECPPLTIDSMIWFMSQYLTSPAEAQLVDASPLLSNDLSGLPPTVIVTAQFDVLRHQIDEYASKLEQSGVSVVKLHYDGVVHGFFGRSPLVAKATRAVNEATRALSQLLTSEEA